LPVEGERVTVTIVVTSTVIREVARTARGLRKVSSKAVNRILNFMTISLSVEPASQLRLKLRWYFRPEE
jgi:hypothetical protein